MLASKDVCCEGARLAVEQGVAQTGGERECVVLLHNIILQHCLEQFFQNGAREVFQFNCALEDRGDFSIKEAFEKVLAKVGSEKLLLLLPVKLCCSVCY